MTDFNPSQLNQLDTQRLMAYRSNLDFYNGLHWQTTSRNRQLVFNYAKVSIDKVTSFLMQGLTSACFPSQETPDLRTRAQQAEYLLHTVHKDNNLEQLDYETEIDTAILGDGCYKVIWDATHKRITITAPDVSGIFAWWLGDDTSRVWRVASRYTLSQDEISILYALPMVSPSGDTTITHNQATIPPPKGSGTITELWTADTFDLYLDNNLIESKPNPYGFIPFIIFPNVKKPKQFWGESDIPVLIAPQRELNRALSQLSRILELSGNPIAVLENVASSEDIKVQPGAVWTIPEDAKAYLLDLLQGGGVRLHIDYIDLLYRALHDISETPRAAWGGVDLELSGAALNIELGSLIQKVNRKRIIRTNIYHTRNDMILRLAEKFMNLNFQNITHRIVWGPILPQDAARQAQNEQLLVQAGIHSRRTAMDEMGIQNPDDEFQRWLDERRKILEMNKEFKAASTRGGARERALASEMEVPE
jgi:hypothetical protein